MSVKNYKKNNKNKTKKNKPMALIIENVLPKQTDNSRIITNLYEKAVKSEESSEKQVDMKDINKILESKVQRISSLLKKKMLNNSQQKIFILIQI